jgi:hypothetical protein
MRKLTLWILAIALGAGGNVRAQSSLGPVDVQMRDNTLSGAMLRSNRFILAPDEIREYRLENYFLRNNIAMPTGGYLAQTPDRLYGMRRYELTTFQTTLEGAAMGVTVGMFAGALANTFGLWNENASWYAAGAMGALGAILGGTYGQSNKGFSVRYDWDLSDD